MSETQHWYDKEGKPAYTIIGKNGKERNTTLRDARQLGLVPSVTTITKQLAAPGLNYWLQKQAILSALTLPKNDEETEEAYLSRIMSDSKEQGRKAAERGTIIHDTLEKFFTDGTVDRDYEEIIYGTRDKLLETFGEQQWVCEESFSTDTFGGKTDIHSTDYVLDFKTKEFTEDNLPDVYVEHIMQLSAYREGLKLPNAKCGNVFISATVPGLVHIVMHSEEDSIKGWKMFQLLQQLWQLSNNFEYQ